MKNLPSFILPLMVLWSVYGWSQPDENQWQSVYSKYNLDPKGKTVIVAINSASCLKCLNDLDRIQAKLNQDSVRTLYWIYGIRKKEKDYYCRTKLNLDPEGKEIIVDNELFRTLNPSTHHMIIEVGPNNTLKRYEFSDYAVELPSFTFPVHRTGIIDSFLIREDRFLVDQNSEFYLLNDSLLLLLDLKYNRIFQYNYVGEKMSKPLLIDEKELELMFKSVYPDQLQFEELMEYRKHQIKIRGQFERAIVRNFFVTDSSINLSVQLQFYRDVPAGDTVVWQTYNSNFMIRYDRNLDFRSLYAFPGMVNRTGMEPCYIISSEVFYFINEKEFISSLHCGGPGQDKYHKYVRLILDENQVKVTRTYDFQLPAYYIENDLYYNFNSASVFLVNDQLYTNFNILPWFYKLESGEQTDSLKNVDFEHTKIDLGTATYHFGFTMLSNEHGKSTSNGTYKLAGINGSKDITLFGFDAEMNEISRKQLPELSIGSYPFFFYGSYIYFISSIKNENEDLYLYKYAY